LEDRLRLVQEVAHRWDMGASEHRTARAPAFVAWQGPEPQRRDRGLPESAKTTGVGGEQRGCDGGKKVHGRKRHLLVDTEGLVLGAKVHSARVHDEDGIKLLVESARIELSRLKHLTERASG
jgi:Transposase DDE domain